MKVTMLAENYSPFALGVKAEHGFSACIEKDGRYFLYDPGQFGLCADNAPKLHQKRRSYPATALVLDIISVCSYKKWRESQFAQDLVKKKLKLFSCYSC